MFGEINDFPETVFKYRVWTNPAHQTILSNQIVFMAPPSCFEDPKDCKSMKRYDLMTDQDIYDKYYNHSQKKNQDWSNAQHAKFAEEWFSKSPMRDKEHLKKMAVVDFERFNERFGVLSLTEKPALEAMWAKYADNHKGFCVGFHPKIMFEFLGGGGIVTYHDELPIINYNDDHQVEHFKQIMCKERKWEFEKEYRTFMFRLQPLTIDDRRIKLPRECYSKIIFGSKMEKKCKEEIIDTCKKQNLPIMYHNCVLTASGEITINEVNKVCHGIWLLELL